MLSIAPLGAASGGRADYYKNLAKKDDYYQNGGEPPGQWAGAGVQALGIHGQITNQQLDRLFRGEHPETGEALVQGAGDKHRAGWDLTFSAPKSVTAAWAVAEPELRDKIQAAQARAVERAISFLEKNAAFARRGQAGEEHEKLPGLIVAKYSHSTSREQDDNAPDPQLHDHCLVLNVAQRADGTFGSIESKYLMKWKMAAGAAYRAELAAEMQKIGFKTEADGNFFKLAGISEILCDNWSKRRQAIEAKLEETGYTSAVAASHAALNTRTVKGEINRADLHERWEAEAAELGVTADIINRLARGETIKADAAAEAPPADDEQLEKPANIYEKLTWNESVFDEQKLFEIAAIEVAHSGGNVDDVEARVQQLLDDKEILKLRGEQGETVYTTRGMRAIENGLVDDAVAQKNETNHVVAKERVDAALESFAEKKGFSLSAEQQKAARHVTENAGGISIVRGAAGAGKSTMAEAARMAWESAGKHVIGCAPSGKAAKGLQESAGIESSTIHRLLFDIESGKKTLDKNTVIVVDEAGMVGSRLMSRLTTAAGAAGAKVVLVGDQKQLQSVSAGGAFRLLQNNLGYAELNEVRRQRDTADRDAAAAISDGRAADAMQSYLVRGRIKIVQPPESENREVGAAKAATIKTLVGDWSTAAFQGDTAAAKHAIQESLILAGTRADVLQLNDAARDAMKEQHMLCNEHAIKTKSGEREFAEGDRIMLDKNNSKLGVKNGELGWIERIDISGNDINAKIRLDDGQLKSIKLAGEGAYTDIDHGYAVTTHKSQGATVDRAYALLSRMNDAELSYVQMSRQRDAVMLYASASMIEDELEKAAASAEATPGMIKLMDKIAKEKDIDKAENEDFLTVRDWLDTHSKKRLGHEEQESINGSERDLKDWISLMGKSHQKATSMDYEIVEPPVVAEQKTDVQAVAEERKNTEQAPTKAQAHELAMTMEYEAE